MINKNRMIILKGAAAALMLTALTAYPAWAGEKVASQGVYIDDISVGGMTADEIRQTIADRVAAVGQTAVTVSVGENQIPTTVSALGLKWTNTEIVDEIMGLGTCGDIVSRYKAQKDLEQNNQTYTLDYSVDDTTAKAFAQSLTVYNTQPVNAEIYTSDSLLPAVSGGTNGISVNVAGSAEKIEEAVQAWDKTSPISVDLAVDEVAPDIPADELAQVCDPLGSATTDFSASSAGRWQNVENGCRLISGTLLYPGESFSVTQALVPFTPENGYELAGSYEENQVVQSYGGGICQVSTTLYNAVLKAELEVTARSNHTMVVNYVDLSKDAAIAEGVMDFSFYNNKETPVYIIGYTYGGQINFTIYGHETRPANRTLEFESRTIATVEPTGAKLAADTAQPVGYLAQTQSPHTGYSAELWKNIYIDGVLSESVQINSSYYTAVGTVYDVGVATDNALLSQAMYTAISTGDVAQVQAVIANAATYTQPQTETNAAAPETQAQTDPNGTVIEDEDDNIVIG